MQCIYIISLSPTYQALVPDQQTNEFTKLLSIVERKQPYCTSRYQLIDTTTQARFEQDWLKIDDAGDIYVDNSYPGREALVMVRYTETYPADQPPKDSPAFKVQVKCPPLTVLPLQSNKLTFEIKESYITSKTKIILNDPLLTKTPFVFTISKSDKCGLSYSLFDVNASQPFNASWLQIQDNGDLNLYTRDRLRSGQFMIQYTYENVTFNTSSFSVDVTCSPIQLAAWFATGATVKFTIPFVEDPTQFKLNKTLALEKAVEYAGCPVEVQILTLEYDAYPASENSRLEADKIGQVLVDQFTPAVYDFLVRILYADQTIDSGPIKITVECEPQSKLQVNLKPRTWDFVMQPNIPPIKVYRGDIWKNNKVGCPITYELFNTTSKEPFSSDWLWIDSMGTVLANVSSLNTATLSILYTYSDSYFYTPEFTV